MFATDQTVRMRTLDLPVKPIPPSTIDNAPAADNEPKTTRLRLVDATKMLPKAISGFDGKTVRLRPVDLPAIGTVAKTVRQRYADLSTVERGRPTKWELARMALILVLASMPILGISVDVSGLVSQGTTSIAVIVLTAVLGTLVVFAPHRTDMIVGRGLIAGMVACIVYDAARLFAVHVLGLMGDFIPVMGSFVTGEPDTTGSAAVGYIWRYIGDAGGLGVAFFVVAFALGIDRWSNVKAVLASVAFARLPHLGRLDGNCRTAATRRGDDVRPQPRDGDHHPGRPPDLRTGPRAGLPEGTAWPEGQRLAVDTDPGDEDVPAVHSRRVATYPSLAAYVMTARSPTADALSRSNLPGQEVRMSSHLEVSKPSGRELVPLSGQRLTLGKASTNDVSLDHDETVSRLHAVLENLGFAWSIRDLGSRNGTYINGDKITAERVLRSGDEVRIGKVRLLFWEVRESGDGPREEETKAAQPNELPPRLTRREVDVLVVLCRPLVSDDPFPEPASVRKMAGELYVTEAAVKQHLQNMYDKFAIPTEGDRRVRLANEALRRGAVTIAQLREGGS